MGSLEFAIREHLELKRLHGADPAAVARAEVEALSPAEPGDSPPQSQHERPALFDRSVEEPFAAAASGPEPHERHVDPANAASLSRETEEFDVESFLDASNSSPVRARRLDSPRSRCAGLGDWREEAIDWQLSG